MATEQVTGLWAEAVEAYNQELGQESRMRDGIVQLQHLSSVHDVETSIEEMDNRFDEFRQRQPKLWKTLKNFLKPLQVLLRTISEPLAQSTVGIPVSVIISAVVNLLQSCERVSASYDQVEEMFSHLGGLMSRLPRYDGPMTEEPLKRIIVNALHMFVVLNLTKSSGTN
jgi:adenosyl cobinamide kinase/adenosyl cobinamide phosphate guanylyltransferase